ncbi:DHHA1 domain protein [Sinorhizobium sp. KGO-5]|uniref:DHHA1 domain-containing protein n=1 Tax=Sinorhizobium sp. KGO-5 TaxID=1470810 RepID=UPI002948CC64|nr:DHHA1 domain protein [Sinorhizobium sp. KGO-5]
MVGWKPNLCIYHGNCDDGFGAAWAIWKRWPDCRFVPAFHGKPLPDVAGADVLFVDFAPPIEWIWRHSSKSRSMVIIDHHKTAQADLERLPPFDGTMQSLDMAFKINWTQNTPEIAAWFDMDQSGAVMAWRFENGMDRDCLPPAMLSYIQDRDLWRFNHGEDTRWFSAALRTYPMQFEVWDGFAKDPQQLIAEGKIVLRAHQANIRKLLREAYMQEIAGHLVPVVNAPYHYASDTAHELLAEHPDAPFAACWFRRGDGQLQWSLRSEDNRLDVSTIAKQFGGGGHRNAAGFQSTAFLDPDDDLPF